MTQNASNWQTMVDHGRPLFEPHHEPSSIINTTGGSCAWNWWRRPSTAGTRTSCGQGKADFESTSELWPVWICTEEKKRSQAEKEAEASFRLTCSTQFTPLFADFAWCVALFYYVLSMEGSQSTQCTDAAGWSRYTFNLWNVMNIDIEWYWFHLQ